MNMISGFWNVLLQKQELPYLLRIAFSAGLGGFIYGYYLGVINNFPPNLNNWDGINNSLARQILPFGPFESTHLWISYYGFGRTTLVLYLLITVSCAHRIQPRNLATLPCAILVVGAFVFLTFLKDIRCIFGMSLIGCGTGYILLGSTIYLAEISPTRIRGAMVATFFLQIAVGQITYYLISLAILFFDYSSFNDDKKYLEKYWHWVLGIIPVLFIFKLRNWLPDSPNRLYAWGKKEEAIEILRKTRPSIEDVAREVEDFKIAEKNIITDHPPFPENIENIENIVNKNSPNGIAGTACLVAEHLVGIEMVMYYTPRILIHVLQLDQYPASSKYLMLATLLTKSVLSAIGTLLCIAFVDRYGRRRLLLLTTFGIITCLGFLSIVLYGRSSDIVASCTITGNGGMGNLGLLALGALGLYFIFHSMGIGTIPWIINTEIYPLETRIYSGTTTWFYWFTKTGISRFYRYLNRVIGQYNIGNLFAILCLLSCLACYIIYVYALDTTIEEVEKFVLMEEKKKKKEEKKKKISSSSYNEINTNREEMPYMFSSSSSDDEGMNEVNQIKIGLKNV